MRLYRVDADQWAVDAPAKLNLFFEVLAKRSDGYHEIETLMCPIGLYDTILFSPNNSGQVRLFCAKGARAGGDDLPADEHNLVVRAIDLLRERTGCRLGAEVRLIKRIPMQAGLGGGSSDAAAALAVASQAWGLAIAPAELRQWAAELGSDVPFFLGRGAAVCRGRGEIIEPAPGGGLSFVVVRPDKGLSTAEVYRRCCPPDEPRSAAAAVSALGRGDASALGRALFNRLEPAAASLSPWIERLRCALSRLDLCGFQMSGSGTAFFGVCRHARHARIAAMRLTAMGFRHVFAVGGAA